MDRVYLALIRIATVFSIGWYKVETSRKTRVHVNIEKILMTRGILVYQQDHRSCCLLKHFIDFCGLLTTGLTLFHFEREIKFGCFKPDIPPKKLSNTATVPPTPPPPPPPTLPLS